MTIQRYTNNGDRDFPWSDGRFVLYSDHAAEIARLTTENERLRELVKAQKELIPNYSPCGMLLKNVGSCMILDCDNIEECEDTCAKIDALEADGGGKWSRKERPRVDTHPLQTKLK